MLEVKTTILEGPVIGVGASKEGLPSFHLFESVKHQGIHHGGGGDFINQGQIDGPDLEAEGQIREHVMVGVPPTFSSTTSSPTLDSLIPGSFLWDDIVASLAGYTVLDTAFEDCFLHCHEQPL